MRYAGVIENDFANGEGVSVTVFLQGCHRRCEGCHNPETWSFSGGEEISIDELINKILTAIPKNGVTRNLSISGGEPLCDENISNVRHIIEAIRDKYSFIKIFCWTGYDYNDLFDNRDRKISYDLGYILNEVDVLITGPYKKEKRNITLKLRGSENQHIYRKDKNGVLKMTDE